MTKAEPIFFIDVSGWNDIEIDGLPNYIKAVAIKATQSDNFVNPLFERQLAAARRKKLIVILYHFLDATATAEAQADHFLSVARDAGPVILATDFEAYGDYSPTNNQLGAFNQRVKRLSGCALWLYSGKGFWESGTPSGNFEQYNADVAWDAYYLDMALHRDSEDYYQRLLRSGFGWGERWGGIEPDAWQFTSQGFAARRFVDFNAYRKTLQEFSAQPTEVSRDVPVKPRKPRNVDDDVKKVKAYLEKTVGGDYVMWEGGGFTRRAPAWVRTTPPPAKQVREEGMFCAAAFTLALEVLGLPLPIPQDPTWEGGLWDYGNNWIYDMKIAEPYRPSMKVQLLDAFLVEYQGPALSDQGHAWFKWEGDKCYQSDLPLGINTRRTMPETIAALTHGRKVWIVRREKWMRHAA